ncbi:hypothetical protein ACFC80_02070 [Enterococcus casseliflavus]|uniref:hypothetical protein n=1 Tax=Enterococcus casseliflavus TaxID=37734 RepID=UPI0039A4CB23
MNLFEKPINFIRKKPYWTSFFIGVLLGFVIIGSLYAPDTLSSIAAWIGTVGGLFIIYQGLKEFEYSREKKLEIVIDFPYESSYSNRGEIMPFMNDTSFFSGRFINTGLRKIILVDGGIRSSNKIENSFNPDDQGEDFIGDILDGSNFGGIEFSFPCEISQDEFQEFKKSRKENLDPEFLLNPEYKYVIVWVKEASGEIFSKTIETPYYHDKLSS